MNRDNNIYKTQQRIGGNNYIYGYTTISMGDMRNTSSQIALTKRLGISPLHTVSMKLVHSDRIAWVSNKDGGLTFEKTDGLLTKEKDLFLQVLVADCLPVFLIDPKKTVIGVIHAGWRGLYKEIIQTVIMKMIKEGSSINNVVGIVGPCIHSECYVVQPPFVRNFENKFDDKFKTDEYVYKNKGQIIFDLVGLAKMQLIKVGINKKNIIDVNICTYDNLDFYSFRRQKEKSGRFSGFIARV